MALTEMQRKHFAARIAAAAILSAEEPRDVSKHFAIADVLTAVAREGESTFEIAQVQLLAIRILAAQVVEFREGGDK